MSNRSRRQQTEVEYDHPYADVDASAIMGPDGTIVAPKHYADMLAYAPYGKGNFSAYWKEIVANVVLKEGLAVLFVSFLLPGVVSTAPGPDPVSRAMLVGLVAALSLATMNSWGYNDRVPRHMTAGATITEWILNGHINWFLALLYLGIGFLFAVVGAAVLWSTGTSAIPIIGTPNNQWAGTAFVIQFFFTTIIALTVLDQFTTRRGRPRTFKGRKPSDSPYIDPFRAYSEDVGARPFVYAMIVWLVTAFCYLKWGLFTFSSYTYFAGALGLQFLGCTNAFNNVNCITSQGAYVGGAAALFILTDVAAWLFAGGLNILLYRLHNNEPRLEDDDSSYGDQEETTPVKSQHIALDIKPKKGRKRITSTNTPSIESRLNLDASAWAGGK